MPLCSTDVLLVDSERACVRHVTCNLCNTNTVQLHSLPAVCCVCDAGVCIAPVHGGERHPPGDTGLRAGLCNVDLVGDMRLSISVPAYLPEPVVFPVSIPGGVSVDFNITDTSPPVVFELRVFVDTNGALSSVLAVSPSAASYATSVALTSPLFSGLRLSDTANNNTALQGARSWSSTPSLCTPTPGQIPAQPRMARFP